MCSYGKKSGFVSEPQCVHLGSGGRDPGLHAGIGITQRIAFELRLGVVEVGVGVGVRDSVLRLQLEWALQGGSSGPWLGSRAAVTSFLEPWAPNLGNKQNVPICLHSRGFGDGDKCKY